MVQDVATGPECATEKAAPSATAAEEGTPVFDEAGSCIDYCPNSACACRARVFAGCSLPFRSVHSHPSVAAGIEPADE
jgi:hypothetical protein